LTESSVAKNHKNKVSLSFELVQSRLNLEHFKAYKPIMELI